MPLFGTIEKQNVVRFICGKCRHFNTFYVTLYLLMTEWYGTYFERDQESMIELKLLRLKLSL